LANLELIVFHSNHIKNCLPESRHFSKIEIKIKLFVQSY
jgi:hypothetical protein